MSITLQPAAGRHKYTVHKYDIVFTYRQITISERWSRKQEPVSCRRVNVTVAGPVNDSRYVVCVAPVDQSEPVHVFAALLSWHARRCCKTKWSTYKDFRAVVIDISSKLKRIIIIGLGSTTTDNLINQACI